MEEDKSSNNDRNDSDILRDLMKHATIQDKNDAEYSFYEVAVKSLIRILRKNGRGMVEHLIGSVQHQDPDTPCVIRPRNRDGRIQGNYTILWIKAPRLRLKNDVNYNPVNYNYTKKYVIYNPEIFCKNGALIHIPYIYYNSRLFNNRYCKFWFIF